MRICRISCSMEQREDRRTFDSTRDQMEVQPTRSSSLWRSMGAAGQKLQESNVCSVGEQISNRGRSINYDVYCGTNDERKTVDFGQFRC